MEGIQNNQNSNNDVEQKREKDQQILANMKKQQGKIQNPMKVMAKRPGTLASFMTYWSGVFQEGPLTARERSLIATGVAVAMRSPQCVSTHSNRAREAGASDDEVVQAMMIASVMLGASPLRAAYNGVQNEE
jgi:AhpD family alkylhydroperoxidase